MTQNNVGIYASQISGHLWAPNGAFDALATTTVGSTSVASITFSGIPQGYKHLQIRGIVNTTTNGQGRFRFNGDTNANYVIHSLYGDGSSAGANNATGVDAIFFERNSGISNVSNVFSAVVIDILDYSSTTKNKVTRNFSGHDTNGGGGIHFESGMWLNTSAVTSITIFNSGTNMNQYSQFALYGVK